MKHTQHNKEWLSIVLALWITLVLWMISIIILEYIIPFSRNIKWVENSSSAYYHSYSGIEESLWELSQNSVGYNHSTVFTSTSTGSRFRLQSTTSLIPPAWDGNSEYDSDWNRFDINFPIQLQLGTSAINFNSATFIFRIPDLDRDGLINDGNLANVNDPIINMTFSWINSWWSPVFISGKDAVNNPNYIKKNQINNSTFSIWWYEGLTLDNDTCTIQNFYNNTCPSVWSGIVSDPTLKLSIIDELELVWGQKIPYLEYQINFWVNVPWRYSQIDAIGQSYGYKKIIDIKVPQLSTNQAFDFAVFQ